MMSEIAAHVIRFQTDDITLLCPRIALINTLRNSVHRCEFLPSAA